MRGPRGRFNFRSMTHASLSRVIVLMPALLWACAHEQSDFPEQLGAGDAPVTSSGGSSAGTSGLQSTTGGTPSGGGTGASSSAGTAGKPSSGGAGGSSMVVVDPRSDGGAGGDDGGIEQAGKPSGTSGSGGTTMGGSGAAGSPVSVGGVGGGVSGASGSTTGGSCDGVGTWSLKTYKEGDRVQAGGKLYSCKPYPYEGWCGLSAYEPAKGTYWEQAWTLAGGC